MSRTAILLTIFALAVCLTAFLPGFEPEAEVYARAALARQSVPVTPSSLLDAVRRKDRAMLELLLEAGVHPDVEDGKGRTPLMLALHGKRPDLAGRLMDAGANLHGRDEDGNSVLGYALRAGETSVVTHLVDRGVDPNTTDARGGGLVVEAVRLGRTASAKVLMDAGASKRATDAEDTQLIFRATEQGAGWMVERLIACGVETEARNAQGESLVHALVRADNVELLRLLWRHGIDLNAFNAHGETAVHAAILAGRPKVLQGLLERGASATFRHPSGWDPLHLAVQKDDVAATNALLVHGADPGGKGSRGRTPLDLALALNAAPGIFDALLQAGADPDQRGPDGQSALDLLLARRELERAAVFLERGAQPGPALHNAVVEGDLGLFDFLLSSGVKNGGSSTDSALVAAVRVGRPEMVAKLLEVGAPLGRKGREGQSALHLAVAMDRVDLAKLLLDAGSDPNEPFARPATETFLAKVRAVGYLKNHLRHDSRVTPLMAAADSGNLALARLLLDHGARRFVWTKRKSYYPIGFASRRDDVKMMQLLLGVEPEKEERWIRVDLSEQMAWVYDKDNKEMFATKISSGKKGYRTRTGEFVITNKSRHHVSNIYKGARMPYFQRFSCGDFGFHEGHCPGHPASHGCLRVPKGKAEELWKITRPGDRVVIVP